MRHLLSKEYIPFGTQYYRAPSPAKEEWEKDLAAIAALGLNTVKFWVQWRWNNPREGEYDFADIDALMDLAQSNGLRVMLNTIVDVAPAWIYRKYPDASMVTLDGRRIGPQVQPHRQIGGLGVCFNHPSAMERMFEFLRVAIRRYREHPALEMWNVASEPELTSSMAELRLYADNAERMGDMLCYCAHCREAFVRWLQKRYVTIGALNVSWNRNYAGFEEVELPVTRNSFNDMIDWRMFFVHTIGEHVGRRFAVARDEDGGKHPLLCHHVFIQGFPVTSTANDPWNVARYGDLHGITQMDDPMMCDVLRSSAKGKPVISAEMLMLFGYTLDLPKPVAADDVKRYVFNGIAANLKGFIFWQYRPETLAREAPAWGLTRLDGSPTPWLRTFAEVNAVLQKNAAFLLDARPRQAKVALLYSPENQVFGWAATGNEKNVTDSLRGIHAALYRNNYVVDFLHSAEVGAEGLAPYRVVFVPFPYYLSRQVCEALAAWVERGGVLMGEAYFVGWDTERGKHQTTVPGHGLHRIFKAHQDTAAPAADEVVEITLTADLPLMKKGEKVQGAMVREMLIAEGADVIARFPDGEAAVTHSRHGEGHAILIGTYLGLQYQRTGMEANARLIAGLIESAADLSHPYAAGNAPVRVDILAAPGGDRMLIVRNLASSGVEAQVTLPDFTPGTLTEQFSGETLKVVPHDGKSRMRVGLRAGEVRVFRD
ncbi:MAG: beta-galactosidase [Bacteroidota bacterium]